MEKLFEYVKKEWGVLKTAPFSFVGLALLSVLSGATLAGWHYSERISTLETQAKAKEGEIGRYRVALGIDKSSRGAVIELTNEELRAKAANTISQLREFCVAFRNRSQEVERQSAKADGKKRAERNFQVQQSLAENTDGGTPTIAATA